MRGVLVDLVVVVLPVFGFSKLLLYKHVCFSPSLSLVPLREGKRNSHSIQGQNLNKSIVFLYTINVYMETEIKYAMSQYIVTYI